MLTSGVSDNDNEEEEVSMAGRGGCALSRKLRVSLSRSSEGATRSSLEGLAPRRIRLKRAFMTPNGVEDERLFAVVVVVAQSKGRESDRKQG